MKFSKILLAMLMLILGGLTRPAPALIISPFLPEASGAPSSEDLIPRIELLIGPARNQGGTELCVGNTIADVVSFHAGIRVSSFSAAVRNLQLRKGVDAWLLNPATVIASQNSNKSPFMIALASSSLHSSLISSFCPDDQPHSSLRYRDSDLDGLYQAHKTFRSYIGPEAPADIIQDIELKLRLVAPGLNVSDFLSQLSPYKTLYESLGEWFDRQCDIKIDPAGSVRVIGGEFFRVPPDEIVANIEKALRSGSLALVHYDAGVLKGRAAEWVQSYIGFHVSSIVAMKIEGDKKQFLLRNSWGNRCEIYSPDIELRCKRGHIWLTEDEVKSYVTSVSYLEFH